MSYQLDLDNGKKPTIEMPPLPEENNTPQVMVENQGEVQQEMVENPMKKRKKLLHKKKAFKPRTLDS